MRKIIDTLPGSGFPKLVGGVSNITGQFTYLGLGPTLFGQPGGTGDLTATAELGSQFGGDPSDLDTSVLMGLSGSGPGGLAVVRGNGFDAVNASAFWEFVDGDTIRLTRTADDNNDLVMAGASSLEFNDFPVDITRGIVTLLGSQTIASTTLASPVAVGRSAVVFRGTQALSGSGDSDEWMVNIYLSDVVGDNYTTITVETGNTGGGTQETHWTILAFEEDANVLVQQHEAIMAGTSTTNTLSPAVDVDKTVLWPMGVGFTEEEENPRELAHEITLTNSTTVTTTRNMAGDTLHQWFNTLEFL
jgi:hypothetical protein